VLGLRTLFALSLLLLLVEPGHVPLIEPDEGRYAEIPREMLASRDFVTPRLNGVVYFEKPPLYYWAVAGSMAVLGQNELAARVPTKLASFLLALLPYLFARRRFGERTALLAGLFVASSSLVVALVRVSLIDACVSAALAAAVFAFAGFQEREAAGDRKGATRALFGLHAACAAALMLKGLIGLTLPGGAILVFLAVTRRWGLFPRLFSPGPLALFLALVLPWHVLAAMRNPGFLGFYVVHEQLLRFATTIHKRNGHPLYFVAVLLAGFFPWTLFFARLGETWPGRRLAAWRDPRRSAETLLWIFSILVFLFFSASKSKLIPYLQPIWPTVGLLLALGIERARERGELFRMERRIAAAVFGLCFAAGVAYAFGAGLASRFEVTTGAVVMLAGFLLGAVVLVASNERSVPVVPGMGAAWLVFQAGALVALPGVARQLTPWPVVSVALREIAAGDAVLQYGDYLQVLPFYLRRLTPIVGLGESELDFGRANPHDPALFPTGTELAALWRDGRRVFAVVHLDRLAGFERLGLPAPRVLATDPRGKHVLLSNR